MTARANTMARTIRLLVSMNQCEIKGPDRSHPAEKDDISVCAVPPTTRPSWHRTCRWPRWRNWSNWDSNGIPTVSLAILRADRTGSAPVAPTSLPTVCVLPWLDLPLVHDRPLTDAHERGHPPPNHHEIRATIPSISRSSTSKLAK